MRNYKGIFVDHVRSMMEQTGLSSAALAKKSGIVPSMMARILSGEGFGLETAGKIADALNIHLADLLRNPGAERIVRAGEMEALENLTRVQKSLLELYLGELRRLREEKNGHKLLATDSEAFEMSLLRAIKSRGFPSELLPGLLHVSTEAIEQLIASEPEAFEAAREDLRLVSKHKTSAQS